jgi:hypothetical protein
MKCYGLGLGLDTFRLVALDANFRKLEDTVTMAAYRRWVGYVMGWLCYVMGYLWYVMLWGGYVMYGRECRLCDGNFKS